MQLLAKEPTTKDPKAVIEKNQAVRSNLRALEENWKELDGAYQAEKNKRRVSHDKVRTVVVCIFQSAKNVLRLSQPPIFWI